jgi:selT/selW/selH-like putative selenoprotein
VFDVRLDGALVFSKKTEGRFPGPEDILTIVRARS